VSTNGFEFCPLISLSISDARSAAFSPVLLIAMAGILPSLATAEVPSSAGSRSKIHRFGMDAVVP